MGENKNKDLFGLIVVILVTSFIETAYSYFCTKTNNDGYILIIESLALFVLQAILLLILKLTKVLSSEKFLKLCTGAFGLVHSVFMALLVSQRISSNIETTLFVFGLFIVLDLILILLWQILYKRRKKSIIFKKTYGSKQRKITNLLSFVGAFAGVFLVRVFDYNIIVFDILISLLSLTYTLFVFCFNNIKTEVSGKA